MTRARHLTTAIEPLRRGATTTFDIPAVLTSRGAIIAEELGVTRGDEFSRAVESLARGTDIVAIDDCFVGRLTSDDERAAVAELIKRALPAAQNPDDVDRLNAHLFRTLQLGVEDPDVAAFVRDGMNATLRERTGTYQSRRKHFNHHDARDALLGCKRIFDHAGHRFFLDRGTLLGCVREGGFIASDYDIDVGIFADEIDLETVKSLFEGTEYRLTQDYEFKVGVASPTGVQIDFFLTTRERGYFLSKGYRSIHNWYFTPFELTEYPFLGEQFLIPDSFEKHLDENYGNWRDPAIFYDLSYNEPCVAYGEVPQSLSYLAKRMGRALRRGWRYYAEAAATSLDRAFELDHTELFVSPTTADVAPRVAARYHPRPIIIVDEFSEYTPLHRRVIESALSISGQTILAVTVDDATADTLGDRLTVARSIDRVASVEPVGVEPVPDLNDLLTERPLAIVIMSHLASNVDAIAVASARAADCEIVVVDSNTMALTLDGDRVIERQRQSTASTTTSTEERE